MYELRYDPDVYEDLDRLNRAEQTKILKQIKKKLAADPLGFGKPLRYDLKGFWRLRVGDYRVIYEVDDGNRMVTVWMIEQRKDDAVYIEFLKRLRSRV